MEMVESFIGRIEVFAISLWKEFSHFEMLDELKSSQSLASKFCPKFRAAGRENCFCCEQDQPEFPLQREGQSGGTESSERSSVSSRKTDRLPDLRQLFE